MNVFADSSGELQNSRVFSFQSIIGIRVVLLQPGKSQNMILITKGCDVKPFHHGPPIYGKVDQTLLLNASSFIIAFGSTVNQGSGVFGVFKGFNGYG